MSLEKEFLRKEPQQSRSRAMIGVLVETVERLIEGEKDTDELSLESIAKRAGVGIGTMYDYFKDRKGLFGTFLARLTENNFTALEDVLKASEGKPFLEEFPKLFDATFSVYFAKEKRTRAAVMTIFRLGWLGPVINERDRFAELVADRFLKEYPAADPVRARTVARVLCDGIFGIILGDLFREPNHEQRLAHREVWQEISVRSILSLVNDAAPKQTKKLRPSKKK
jgi:AcrR family transcriptional regulator